MLIEVDAQLQKDRESFHGEEFEEITMRDILFIRGSKLATAFSVIYDFSRVEDMDSAALWVLKCLAEAFQGSKGTGRLVLCGLKPWMESMLERSRVKDHVKVFDTVSEAVDFLKKENDASGLHSC